MAVTKTADADQAPAGSDVTYTITVSNNGPDSADAASLNDPLPAGSTFVSLSSPAGWSCSTPSVGSGGTVTCNNATYPVTSGDVFTLVVNIPSGTAPGTTFTNQATVSSSTFDPTDENNSASAATTVPGTSADMQVTKTASASEVFADSDITYAIQVNNFGPDDATSAQLSDTLPGNMTFVSLLSPAGWSCITPAIGSGGTISCTNPSFAAGASSGFTLKGHVPSGTSAGTTYNNTASVSSSTSDPDSGNSNGFASTVVVNCLGNLVVTSNADSGAGSLRQAIVDACAGGTITFDMNQVVSPITLTTAHLLINKNLTITGPGANVLTVMRSTAGGTPEFRIFEIASGANVKITGLTISNGAPTPGNTNAAVGGGISNSGTLAIDGVAVSGNRTGSSTAAGAGGGLFNFGTLTVTNSTFSGNQGNTGGGLQSNGSAVTIINSTISGNIAAVAVGGGITLSSGTLTVTNSTISNNRSDFDNAGGDTGGGIYRSPSAGNALLNNTIVAGNFRGTGTTRDDLDGAFSTSSSNNLIGDGTGETGITNGTNGNKVGTNAVPIDPLLAALGNYGGPTQTHRLLPGSPAIDAGSDALAVDTVGDPLANDQRGVGFPRIAGSAVDIGSVEVDYFLEPTAGTPQSTAVNSAFPIALKATLTESDIPVSGISVTFTAPTTGATGTFSSGSTATVVTDANGVATAPTFTANSTPGSYTVAATVIGLANSADFSLTNIVGVTTHFSVSAPANATAGLAFNFTVNALDASNNVVTNYTGTVRFTSNDPNAALPPNSTLTNGTGTFSATLKTAGARTITATDTSTSATGTSNTITVGAAAATRFSVVAPANATAGTAFNFTVTAFDQFNNIATGYTGTVRFTSTDANAALPANSTLTNGAGTFSATLRTVGNQTITATDTVNNSINGTSNTIAVSKNTPGLTGTVSPTSGNVGTPFTDTAVLSNGINPTGTITFTVYGPNAGNCATAIFTSTKTVNGNGSYVSDPFTPTAQGSYTFVALYSGDVNNNPVATVCGVASQTFNVGPAPAQSLNISTRVRTELGDRAMIGGFIISGNAPKSVVIRGLGPSLASFNLTDLLANPQLELKGPNNNLIFLNKDWKDTQRALIEGTNFEPKDDRESVIVITLNPGQYTAILSGEGGTTGIGLVEVYDTSPGSDSKLGNISTRGFVQTGDKVMIGGFTLGGNNIPTRIAVRGRGPSLSQFGLSPVLADPTLELRNQNGTITIVNDDWQSDPASRDALIANGLGLSDPKESGIFTSLPAGQYTAVLAGKGGGIGIGLIEIYNLQ